MRVPGSRGSQKEAVLGEVRGNWEAMGKSISYCFSHVPICSIRSMEGRG